MNKFVNIYKQKEIYKIHPCSKTKDGLWLATEPCFIIPIRSQLNEILDYLKIAFEQSKDNVSHPNDWNIFHKEFLNLLSVKSLSELHKGTKLCDIHIIDLKIEILPYQNKGARYGFLPLNNLKESYDLPMTEKMVQRILFMIDNIAL